MIKINDVAALDKSLKYKTNNSNLKKEEKNVEKCEWALRVYAISQ